jgi:predicted phosphoribosyltransferase
MTIHELASGRQGSLAEDDAGWPDRVMALAQALRTELSGSGVLQDVAQRVLDFAQGERVVAVTGASRVGDQLAGAAVAISSGRLHLATPTDVAVLVVDGLLATGTQIEQAVSRLRTIGTERVVGVVVLAESEALEACRAATGANVIALETV